MESVKPWLLATMPVEVDINPGGSADKVSGPWGKGVAWSGAFGQALPHIRCMSNRRFHGRSQISIFIDNVGRSVASLAAGERK